MSGRPDPKPERRKKADRPEWDTITDAVKARDGEGCLLCGAPDVTRHHVLSRSLGGDDAAENVILLCGSGTTGCHGLVEAHDPEVCEMVYDVLPAAVRAHVEAARPGYLIRRYGALTEGATAGASSRESSVSTDGPTVVLPVVAPSVSASIGTGVNPEPPSPDTGLDAAFITSTPARETRDDAAVTASGPAPVPTAHLSEDSGSGAMPAGGNATAVGVHSLPAEADAAGAPQHSDDELEPCPACKGQGKRKRRAAKQQTVKVRRTYSIAVPKEHLEDGAEVLQTLIRECGKELADLGYDETTPPYFVWVAVASDWLSSRAAA